MRLDVADRPVLSEETLCPTDGPRGITVVLLDASDGLPEIAQQEVRGYLVGLSEELEPYSLLELRLLDPSVGGGRVVFSRCNPGDGSNLNELIGNPQLARRQWLEGFRQPLEDALNGFLGPAPSDTSPIMGTVQHVAIELFSNRQARELPKELVIVSDMLEHTSAYSQYPLDLSFERFKLTEAYRNFRTDLHGADVTIKYVQRRTPTGLDPVKHLEFWLEWARDNNAGLFRADRLQGVG